MRCTYIQYTVQHLSYCLVDNVCDVRVYNIQYLRVLLYTVMYLSYYKFICFMYSNVDTACILYILYIYLSIYFTVSYCIHCMMYCTMYYLLYLVQLVYTVYTQYIQYALCTMQYIIFIA